MEAEGLEVTKGNYKQPLFFFLIGKKKYIQENCWMQNSISISEVPKRWENNKHKLQRKRAKEKRKRVTRCEIFF